MTHARHVIHGATAARIDRICSLIGALQRRSMRRSEIGAMLKVGPSGVRKYLVDLRGKVETTLEAGEQICRLTICAEEVQEYLASLAVKAAARPARTSLSEIDIAGRDPARHIHIMYDDEHFMPRMQRGIPAHHPVMAAFFGLNSVEARV